MHLLLCKVKLLHQLYYGKISFAALVPGLSNGFELQAWRNVSLPLSLSRLLIVCHEYVNQDDAAEVGIEKLGQMDPRRNDTWFAQRRCRGLTSRIVVCSQLPTAVVIVWIILLVFKMGHSRPFFVIFVFSIQLTVNKCSM